MANVKGRGVRVEIAATYATAKTVSAVSLANPAVATSTSHGLANDAVGFFSGVSGMVQLEGQACRVKNTTANTFDLQGLDTSTYAAYTGGTFTPVATWLTLGEGTGVGRTGGESAKLDATRLIDIIGQEETGLLSAQGVSINLFAQDVPSAAMGVLQAAARAQASVIVRVTLTQTGAVRIWRGEPSLPGEDIQVGQLATGSLSMTVKGFVLELAA